MKRIITKVITCISALAIGMNSINMITIASEKINVGNNSVTASLISEKGRDINKIQNSVLSVSATNSIGKLLQEPVSEQREEQEDNNGYNVFSVEMQDKTAQVSMETVEDCTLVVGIYEEDGIKMLATGEREVTQEDREVTLDIEVDTMPHYYLLRAFLLETDTLNPLCSVYETPMYTKEMQDFLSKTTDDFEEDRVLNLDEDKTNNFAVYDEDTKIIRGDDNSNHLKCTNEEKQEYIIENADTSALSLSKGDIFAYERENEEVVMVKVQSVSVTGSTVAINGADTELEDVFEYVKIDETATTEDMEVDSSTCSEEVEYQGKENNSAGRKKAVSGEGGTSVSLSYRFTGKNSPLSGKNKINQKKHKISFEEAQTVFYDTKALVIDDPEHSEQEDRFIILGLSKKANLLVVCHCYRESDSVIRIISARKATTTEEKYYNG